MAKRKFIISFEIDIETDEDMPIKGHVESVNSCKDDIQNIIFNDMGLIRLHDCKFGFPTNVSIKIKGL